MSVSATLSGTIQLTDSTSSVVAFRKNLANLLFTGTIFEEGQSVSIPASPTSITLPISPVQFVYVKNLHATQTIQVTWTPTGGASNVVSTLQPGSCIILCETATGGGISALSLLGSGAATLVEYIIAG